MSKNPIRVIEPLRRPMCLRLISPRWVSRVTCAISTAFSALSGPIFEFLGEYWCVRLLSSRWYGGWGAPLPATTANAAAELLGSAVSALSLVLPPVCGGFGGVWAPSAAAARAAHVHTPNGTAGARAEAAGGPCRPRHDRWWSGGCPPSLRKKGETAAARCTGGRSGPPLRPTHALTGAASVGGETRGAGVRRSPVQPPTAHSAATSGAAPNHSSPHRPLFTSLVSLHPVFRPTSVPP